jgi:hypothetical protein
VHSLICWLGWRFATHFASDRADALRAIATIAVTEFDLTVPARFDTMVRDGHTMRVAAEIIE